MTIKKRYLRVVHLLFIILMLIQLIPNALTTETYASYVIKFAIGLEVITLIASALIKKPLGLNLFVDIVEQYLQENKEELDKMDLKHLIGLVKENHNKDMIVKIQKLLEKTLLN